MDFVLVGLGFAALFGGAELLVRGAIGLARRMGVPPLMIGMTVVAFATSSPEIIVSLDAVLRGASALMVGNLVGSNIANALLVLGITGLFAPIVVARRVLTIDTVFFCLVTAAAAALTFLGTVDRWAASGLLGLYVAQFTVAYRRRTRTQAGSADGNAGASDTIAVPQKMFLALPMGVGGLAVVLVGAEMVVTGASVSPSGLACPRRSSA